MDLSTVKSLIDPSRSGALAAGKTKFIWPCTECDCCVLIESNDNITAGDGAKRDVLAGKGVHSTQTTVNVLTRLEKTGVIQTHLVKKVDARTFRARAAEMIPIEVVARGQAFGSYLLRNPNARNDTRFNNPVIEFFFKDDEAHDPLMVWDSAKAEFTLHNAKAPVTSDSILGTLSPLRAFGPPDRFGGYETVISHLQMMAILVFAELERAWAAEHTTLVDLKIECGFDKKTGQILLCDVVDNDSWRIWPYGQQSSMLDKQVYRDLAIDPGDPDGETKKAAALKQISANYHQVAKMTRRFL